MFCRQLRGHQCASGLKVCRAPLRLLREAWGTGGVILVGTKILAAGEAGEEVWVCTKEQAPSPIRLPKDHGPRLYDFAPAKTPSKERMCPWPAVLGGSRCRPPYPGPTLCPLTLLLPHICVKHHHPKPAPGRAGPSVTSWAKTCISCLFLSVCLSLSFSVDPNTQGLFCSLGKGPYPH